MVHVLSALLFSLALQDPRTELYKLIWEGSGMEKVRPLLTADVTLVNARADLEVTPLHDAVRFCGIDVVKFLVEKGAEVNAVCYNRFTPLYFAASESKLEVVRYLIEKGAKVAAPSEGGTPLQAAAKRHHQDVVKELIKAGAAYDLEASLALFDLDQVKAILEKDPAAARRENVLHQACGQGNAEIVAMLLANGADPNDRGASGRTRRFWRR
jgi:ankyrin repeat protein